MTELNLKPCPFCGDVKLCLKYDDWYYKVICQSCYATGGQYQSEEEAVSNWNWRI